MPIPGARVGKRSDSYFVIHSRQTRSVPISYRLVPRAQTCLTAPLLVPASLAGNLMPTETSSKPRTLTANADAPQQHPQHNALAQGSSSRSSKRNLLQQQQQQQPVMPTVTAPAGQPTTIATVQARDMYSNPTWLVEPSRFVWYAPYNTSTQNTTLLQVLSSPIQDDGSSGSSGSSGGSSSSSSSSLQVAVEMDPSQKGLARIVVNATRLGLYNISLAFPVR